MAKYLSQDLITHLIIFQFLILIITCWNILLSRRARSHTLPADLPKVSILIPARDEEHNIADCVHSLLSQEYPEFEVLVLDDDSQDKTRSILEEIALKETRLTLLEGQPPPENTLGKNWACTQLAEAARGDLFFFTDADTRHHPQTLLKAVTALLGEKADLLTGHPKQVLGSWGERLLVPFFSWAVLVFFPLGLAYGLPWPIFTTAVGQMMLFQRDAYQAIGGHRGIKTSIVDDLALARKIHQAGYRWRVAQISDLISCRMYRNSQEALQGFTKNLFAAFEFRLLPFLFAFIWLGVLFLEPLVLLLFYIAGRAPLTQPLLLATCLSLSLLLWLITYLYLRLPACLALSYPATVLANLVIALWSLRLTRQGKLTWKGRNIQSCHWKWL